MPDKRENYQKMSKGRILVIDDAATVKRFMEINLQQKGYDVISAPNAKSGVSKAQKEHPDLIVTDFVLPDATGGQICSFLRKHPKYDDIPIILISGDKENFENKKLKRLSDIYFMSKPFTGPELANRVEEILKLRKEKKKQILPTPPVKPTPQVDLDKLKDQIFQILESYTDDFIKSKYSFQVKRIIIKAISEAFEKLK